VLEALAAAIAAECSDHIFAVMGDANQDFIVESFMNNVPNPLLSGDSLPAFKFALEKSQGKVIGESYGKEATVTQLPISKGIAGVSMRLARGHA
jgi:oxalate decarboxylase